MKSDSLSNIEKITHVAMKLDYLLDKVVFVGGAVVELLVTDPAAQSIRPTLDVDTIIEISSRAEYYSLEDELRELGFIQIIGENEPICRWYIDSIGVDFMPDIPEILGFSNIWYQDAMSNSNLVDVNEKTSIRMISPPYFIATKIEAFLGRGNHDYLVSHDIEDIITLLDGRDTIVEEINACPSELIDYLSKKFHEFITEEQFLDSIPGHLPPDDASQERMPLVIERINRIIEL
jgi:predicted nucleotidyltransferase